MNCKQVLSYLREHPGGDLTSRIQNTEISSHLATCSECALVVKGQQQLTGAFLSIRNLDCRPPAALDEAVLANYRRQVSELEKTNVVSAWRFRPLAVFAWSAVAIALVFAAILFFSPPRGVTRITATPTDLATESAAQIAGKRAQTPKASTKDAAIRKRNRGGTRRVARSSEPQLPQEAFRGLMYCDELSCSDAMQMIRLQLPASIVTRPMSGSASANGVVTADVLVGPDGIARGIRIEE
ncbi:MAG TPA: hypothetical protein VGS78_05035 [Candidatus Sulfotelmatobacter sp.]|nr:hypothetical protein [Candidatus Sulfotelmatobacter sp.]